jgi:uncharacterized damage-inducible protein DinB
MSDPTTSSLTTLIDRFAAGGPLLTYATTGLTREQEQARPGPGAWSIAELAVHMLDSDLVGADRIKRVIAEPEPTLLAYDENAWNERLRAHELPVAEAVSLFAANRQWVTRLLRQTPEADFLRAGNHTEAGRLTLAELVAKYVSHLDYHLKFLYGKRANLGISIYPRYSTDQAS